jgi:hypothetical protein
LTGGGVRNLVRVIFHWAFAEHHKFGRGSSLLVNAAIVGGLRDELKRDAVRVVI